MISNNIKAFIQLISYIDQRISAIVDAISYKTTYQTGMVPYDIRSTGIKQHAMVEVLSDNGWCYQTSMLPYDTHQIGSDKMPWQKYYQSWSKSWCYQTNKVSYDIISDNMPSHHTMAGVIRQIRYHMISDHGSSIIRQRLVSPCLHWLPHPPLA